MTTGRQPRRTRTAIATGVIAVLALLAGACGSDDESGEASDPGSRETTTAAPQSTGGDPYGSSPAATVGFRDVEPLGQILVDDEEMTLYLFESDTSEKSTCYDACTEVWPPLLTSGDPQVASQADASMLSTLARDDGTTQVVYGGHPLYYYSPDEAPGDTLGQGVEGFGAEWYVVSPDGEPIEGTE